ncbi:prolyl oligopeptidase family serine peptidase [Paraburkholderia acidicola]|uniref:Prolyl oligopeptidase family serine peptidase n=1 Tax=Paraburkholderia acidicola TaxID=1912599 RepID=A0ABV1LF43_9BURK
MEKIVNAKTVLLATLLLSGCGGGVDTTSSSSQKAGPGSLISQPVRVLSLGTQDVAKIAGQALLQVTGTPVCGVDIERIEYATKDGSGGPTTASGVVLMPTGSNPQCSGPRPVVMYAHGTAATKAYNLAEIEDPTNEAQFESSVITAFFAAQGYIVVAPNYAGYDTSTLSYHPYFNATQEGQEMIHALQAGRTALQELPEGARATDSGKLFVTGYSEGGYVAMAALREMQAANIPVSAGAPSAGPYALAAFMDNIFEGQASVEDAEAFPLLSTGYQRAYGNVYKNPSDLYTSSYASGIESLLPSTTSFSTLVSAGKIPATALFQSAPTGNAALDSISPPATSSTSPGISIAFGFSPTNYLLSTSYREAYLTDAAAHPDGAFATPPSTPPYASTTASNAFRQDLALNDLRHYVPTMPMLMCSGHGDPIAPFESTKLMFNILSTVSPTSKVAELDVDPSGPPGTFSSIGFASGQVSTMQNAAATAQGIFSAIKQQTSSAAVSGGATDGGDQAVYLAYHAGIESFACFFAIRSFFQQF